MRPSVSLCSHSLQIQKSLQHSMEEHPKVNPPVAKHLQISHIRFRPQSVMIQNLIFFCNNIQACLRSPFPKTDLYSFVTQLLRAESKDQGKDSRNARHALPPLHERAQTYPFLGSCWLLLSNEGGFKFCKRREAANKKKRINSRGQN